MKVMTILGTASVLALGGTATADVTGVEIVNIGDYGNGTTYHMYLNVTEGTRGRRHLWQLDRRHVHRNGRWHVLLSKPLWRSALSTNCNVAFFPLAPSLQYDTFVTIGALDSTGNPFANNALLDIGIDWS